jgi:hypothetical protein
MRHAACEQIGGGSTARLVLVKQICERLPVGVADDEAGAVKAIEDQG